jgi:formate/nitrite transporter FocA (FNT family)
VGDLKKAGEILETVVDDGNEELGRASLGLGLSGLAAGLNISFSAVALGVAGAFTGGVGLVAALLYPIGFLIVILGRSQLYTENTVTPVAVVLTNFGALPNMLRLWVVVFVANVIGAILFAATVVYGEVLPPPALQILFEEVAGKLDDGFWNLTLKAVVGGWLVALIAWLVAASRDTISQALVIYVLTFLIPAAGLAHCIAGSSEVLIASSPARSPFWSTWAVSWCRPRSGIPSGESSLSRCSTTGRSRGPAPGPRPPSPGTPRRAGQREDS